jgi:hypothetical protein
MASEEKVDPVIMTKNHENIDDVHVVKKVHADGTVDLIDTHAIGGVVEEMPKGYYYSPQFIGTVVVRSSCICWLHSSLITWHRPFVLGAYVRFWDGCCRQTLCESYTISLFQWATIRILMLS